MTTVTLIWRGLAAILLTGLISPLVFSLGFAWFYQIASGASEVRIAPPLVEGVLPIAFVGLGISIPAAAIIGVGLELPKVLLSHLRRWSFLAHVGLSLAGSLLLCAVFLSLVNDGEPPADNLEELIFVFLAFIVGGLTSGMAWWLLVTLPLRRLGTK